MAELEGVRGYLNPDLPQVQVSSSMQVGAVTVREAAGEPSGRNFTPSGNSMVCVAT